MLVFDGAPFRPDLGGQQFGAVSLRFPAAGRDADSVIREIVDGAARPGDLVVVTSDKPLYSYARTRGAQVLRAHEWNALATGAKPSAQGRPGPGTRREARARDRRRGLAEALLARVNAPSAASAAIDAAQDDCARGALLAVAAPDVNRP